MRRVLAGAAVAALVLGLAALPLARRIHEAGYRAGQIDYAAGVRRWIIGPSGRPHEVKP